MSMNNTTRFKRRNRGTSMDMPAAILKEAGETRILAYEMSVPETSKMSSKKLTFFNFETKRP
ncbi:MAG: hypothetical protein Roseis2KO_16890 [Roseivirga sp.]